MKKKAVILLSLLLVLSEPGFLYGNSQPEKASPGQTVLILAGPQYGLPVLDELLNALMLTLDEGGFNLNHVFVEFLDVHRTPDGAYRAAWLELLGHKMRGREPGLILAITRGAVDFMLHEGRDLFPEAPLLVPILEMHFEPEAGTRKLITLSTRLDAQGTLDYAMALFPSRNRAVIIQGVEEEAAFSGPVTMALASRESALTTESTADLSYEEMLALVARLPSNTMAFYVSYIRDISGRSFAPAEVARQVGKMASAPVFAFRDRHIGTGLTGGSVALTSETGKMAAQISLDYLSGALLLEEPVTAFEVPHIPLFDYSRIRMWGGDPNKLPDNTVFINRKPDIWEQHRGVVITASIGFVLLLMLLLALAVRARRQQQLIRKIRETQAVLQKSEEKYRQLADALHESREHFRVIAENMPGVVYQCLEDERWTMLFINDEVESLTGHKKEAFLSDSLSFADLYHPDDRDGVYARSDFCKAEGIPFRHTYRLRHKDGHYHWVEEAAGHIQMPDGKILLVGVITDITERRQMLDKLIAAKEKAEESDRLKTAFLNNISHEIRTPLNSILGFGQLLAAHDYPREKRMSLLQVVEDSGKRLTDTISDYIDMAMIMSGSMAVNMQPQTLSKLFDELVQNTQATYHLQHIEFHTHTPADAGHTIINTDPVLLRKIMRELIHNAVKFTKKGRISYGYETGHDQIRFFVGDTGIGIAADKLDMIFDLFMQENPSIDSGYEGSGLGLSIARGLATLLGGQLQVISEKGKGSVFSFTIPHTRPL